MRPIVGRCSRRCRTGRTGTYRLSPAVGCRRRTDAAAEKPIKGEVVAVGNGKVLENGDVRALDLSAGDKVLFGKYSGTEVKVDGEELLVMKEDDIMAVIEG